ncbi:MAG TPA: hypothetical protein VK176_04700 [Phycisphaerales bacterium]|nr:hypothetical protein [Phycisphaerales bacterium]
MQRNAPHHAGIRVLTQVAIACVLGAMASYLTAWAGYLRPRHATYGNVAVRAPQTYHDRNPIPSSPGTMLALDVPTVRTAHSGALSRLCISTRSGRGFTADELVHLLQDARETAALYTETQPGLTTLMEAWPDPPPTENTCWTEWTHVRAGYPWRCIEGSAAVDESGNVHTWQTLSILPLDLAPAVGPSFRPGTLPAGPLWPGLIANTLCYALLAYPLMLVPALFTRIRRHHRRKHHRCPRCNYDQCALAPDAPCPECGPLRGSPIA